MSYQPISEGKFWGVFDAFPPQLTNPEDRENCLRSTLMHYSIEDVVGFEIVFRRKINEAYTWDLWGAAYLVHGGCSDDCFEYFRRWLVTRGQKAYESAAKDPDSLAELEVEPAGPRGIWRHEEIYYVANDVYRKKGGNGDVRAFSDNESGLDGGDPSGTPFEENEEYLRNRFPRLWHRFGDSPLT